MTKIKENLSQIIKVSAIVAIALIIPTILGLLDETFSESILFSLGYYVLLAASGVCLLVAAIKNCNKCDLLPVIFLSSAMLVNYSNTLVSSGIYFNIVAMVALYVAIIILSIIKNKCKCLKNAYLILLLIASAFQLSGALSGGIISLSALIILVLIIFKEYFVEGE